MNGKKILNFTKNDIVFIYETLTKTYGYLKDWWPHREKEEIIVSAILAQNTSWKNVERSIGKIRKEVHHVFELISLNQNKIKSFIRSCGFVTRKSQTIIETLKLFTSLDTQSPKTEEIRKDLLKIKGIGKETCDSILLYVLNRPIFVVDNYTIRFFSRVFGVYLTKDKHYEHIRRIVENSMDQKTENLKVFHALIVEYSKKICKKKPQCQDCQFHSGQLVCNYVNYSALTDGVSCFTDTSSSAKDRGQHLHRR